MKIKYKHKPVPWLYVRLKKEPKENPGGWISLSPPDGDFVLTKDDPDGPLGGAWMIIHNGYMYDNNSILKTFWVFLTEHKSDRYLVG
jgi:hypothetical protein